MDHPTPQAASHAPRNIEDIAHARLIVGMEVHVELMTRTKMFTRVASPAFHEHDASANTEPNTLIDPLVLALPGSLPVLNRHAIELSIGVGLALNCSIATHTRWDRKSYFYPDLPKAYQISQHQLPLCFDGAVDIPTPDDSDSTFRIAIERAHLEEDAGKLLHEAPGGHAIDHSIVDLNRAGTPLLEIVTAPNFTSADQAVAFAQWLHGVCRWLGATHGIMQAGHMRFEPNINMALTLKDGRTVRTPIVEIKNLNSFKAIRSAIEYEARTQPARWAETGIEHALGTKTTRGWDDHKLITTPQREKEDAHDYRYFPDPDLLPARIDEAWVADLRAAMPELPHQRHHRYRTAHGLDAWEADALTSDRAISDYYEAVIEDLDAALDTTPDRPDRAAATILLQNTTKLANERSTTIDRLGIAPESLAALIVMRERGEIGANAIDPILVTLADAPTDTTEPVPDIAKRLGLIQIRDEAQLTAWCDAALNDPTNAAAIEDVRNGKDAAIGRLVGAVMKASAGQADAKAIREMLMQRIRK